MNRKFLTRSVQDEIDAVMDAVAGRENELASYDANIEAYTQQLATLDATLPIEWPADLLKYRGRSNEEIVCSGAEIVCSGAVESEASTASQMNHRDRVRMLLFTEKAECRKSELAYRHCLECLPADAVELQAALDRYAAKAAAQKQA